MVSEQVASAGWAAQIEAACHLVHFHHQQDLQNAMEARPRRLKVHILAICNLKTGLPPGGRPLLQYELYA